MLCFHGLSHVLFWYPSCDPIKELEEHPLILFGGISSFLLLAKIFVALVCPCNIRRVELFVFIFPMVNLTFLKYLGHSSERACYSSSYIRDRSWYHFT